MRSALPSLVILGAVAVLLSQIGRRPGITLTVADGTPRLR